MTVSGLLAWAWLFTLPGLVLTAAGIPGSRRGAGWASLGGPLVLLVVAAVTLFSRAAPYELAFDNWLPFLSDPAFHVRVDGLSALMLAVLGFVALLVYVYSLGYMADDPGKRRFFAYLDLFVAAMSLLLLAGNLAVLLIGWTGVGISSFLLISFWRDREHTLGAGLQALAANAIGDGALLLAAVLVPRECAVLVNMGTARCLGDSQAAPEFLALLLFVAAAAKSAQGPLYFWLPSAMAGPTPISALIHAATMVAAGVYLLVRTHVLIEAAPIVASWIAVTGVATALLASVMSLRQANFKRGVAYSTVAQLGYMFAAVGVGSSFAGLFHLVTHAGFKALLFLAAGVVIHSMGGEERLDRLSGHGRRFGFSYWGFLLGSLALIGVPFTSGGLSKDAILEAAFEHTPWVGYALLAGTLLTGLYAGRLFFRVYHGPLAPVATTHQGADATHEHPETHDPAAARYMDWALVPLMVSAVFAGFLAWPGELLPGLLGPTTSAAPRIAAVSPTGLIAFALGLAGFLGAGFRVRRGAASAGVAGEEAAGAAPWVHALAQGGYALSGGLSAVQTGRLPRYAFGSVVAVALILVLRVVVR